MPSSRGYGYAGLKRGDVPPYLQAQNFFAEAFGLLKAEASPLVKQVVQVEERAEKAMQLAGDILATMRLEGNQYLFEQMPEDWQILVESWLRRYRRLKGDSGEEVEHKEGEQ